MRVAGFPKLGTSKHDPLGGIETTRGDVNSCRIQGRTINGVRNIGISADRLDLVCPKQNPLGGIEMTRGDAAPLTGTSKTND